MGIDFAGDLGEMLSKDDHGAEIAHASGSTEGILNNEFFEVELGSLGANNVGVGGSEPAVYVPSNWAAGVLRGDAITVTPEGESAQSFIVAALPEPDGTGLSRIALQTV